MLIAIEHGITGDVLVMMDHEALNDMGMSSLGHRLKLLRAVWEVKRDQGMDISEDEWQPQDLPDVVAKGMEVDRLLETVTELRKCHLHQMSVEQARSELYKYGYVVGICGQST
jgi:hypothetical protein